MMTLLYVFIGIVAVLILLGSIYRIFLYDKETFGEGNLDFKKSLDQAGLPIVKLYHNKEANHFIVDTGANFSVLNIKDLDKFKCNKLDCEGSTFGIDGKRIPVNYVEIDLTDDEERFYKEVFQLVDIDTAMNNLEVPEEEIPVGILGNSFLTNYKGKIDFNKFNLKIYGRKNKA